MFRPARESDLTSLRDLEREANLFGLSHVFPPDRFPFPDDDVLARWRIVMDDPSAEIIVADDESGRGLIAFSAYDDSTLRHVAVHPDHWGEGLATTLIEAALDAMQLRGCTVASLWCLRENRRASRLYRHLGWRVTDDAREAPWPPHPIEIRYTRSIVAPDR